MSNEKTKILKNPARNTSEPRKPYVSQYQILGVEPSEYKSAVMPKNVMIAKGAPENPRLPRSPIRQPYAEPVPSPIGRDKGLIPNVGNNMEHSWSGVDDEIIDNLEDMEIINPEHEMIDNNEFVSPATLGLSEEDVAVEPETGSFDFSAFVSMVQSEVEENECVLFVSGMWLSKGSPKDIEKQVQDLMFGEHEVFKGEPISIEDILVVKKVPIKVGVFFSE